MATNPSTQQYIRQKMGPTWANWPSAAMDPMPYSNIQQPTRALWISGCASIIPCIGGCDCPTGYPLSHSALDHSFKIRKRQMRDAAVAAMPKRFTALAAIFPTEPHPVFAAGLCGRPTFQPKTIRTVREGRRNPSNTRFTGETSIGACGHNDQNGHAARRSLRRTPH